MPSGWSTTWPNSRTPAAMAHTRRGGAEYLADELGVLLEDSSAEEVPFRRDAWRRDRVIGSDVHRRRGGRDYPLPPFSNAFRSAVMALNLASAARAAFDEAAASASSTLESSSFSAWMALSLSIAAFDA
jgi:hypothetical protein